MYLQLAVGILIIIVVAVLFMFYNSINKATITNQKILSNVEQIYTSVTNTDLSTNLQQNIDQSSSVSAVDASTNIAANTTNITNTNNTLSQANTTIVRYSDILVATNQTTRNLVLTNTEDIKIPPTNYFIGYKLSYTIPNSTSAYPNPITFLVSKNAPDFVLQSLVLPTSYNFIDFENETATLEFDATSFTDYIVIKKFFTNKYTSRVDLTIRYETSSAVTNIVLPQITIVI